MNATVTRSHTGNILIVDDSPENLRVLSNTLIRQGHIVRCVTNSSMALISIKKFPPDLILLDVQMPEVNGYEICQQLKTHPETAQIPVIFLSALNAVEDVIQAFRLGGADYITKPFQTEEVLARIHNQLAVRKLQQQLAEQNHQLKQEIDERKKTEQALRQEIQHRITIEAELQDAKEAAEAASYARSKFLTSMSHELRTPLNAILGFSEIIEQDASLSSINREYLTIIHQSGRNLLKLINNILSITSAEASKLALHEQDLDLHQFLDTMVANWQPRVIAKGLHFTFSRSPDVPRLIRADESKLRQALVNLLENALKFTSIGQIAVNIRLADNPEPSSGPSANVYSLLFEIVDTGHGISTDEMGSLFQAFSQTETGRKLGKGVGLGLLISRQLAQLMGGEITITSTSGQGTVAQLSIPVHPLEFRAIVPQSIAQLYHHVMHSSQSTETLTPETLKTVMPADWLAKLHEAAVKGFDQQILHLVRDIPDHQAHLSEALITWTRNFQFDRIEALTQQAVR